ncbi:hypothetical protein DICVIV_07663 [Dictyocaulus viviparus]|uniref:Uncharacterized protein n=1 Tax=Dictyocaulus viviparus TaxID=29172 RepID=A0A0D8XP32_DICVI|nr:hypothetical protein DICVIV_07663 [Dictyocaulus viviparus]
MFSYSTRQKRPWKHQSNNDFPIIYINFVSHLLSNVILPVPMHTWGTSTLHRLSLLKNNDRRISSGKKAFGLNIIQESEHVQRLVSLTDSINEIFERKKNILITNLSMNGSTAVRKRARDGFRLITFSNKNSNKQRNLQNHIKIYFYHVTTSTSYVNKFPSAQMMWILMCYFQMSLKLKKIPIDIKSSVL